MAPWLPLILQMTDSMFPTGAYAHSLGLEGAVQDGFVTDPDSFREFLNEVIVPGMIYLELPAVAHAYEAATDRQLEDLCQQDQTYGAMKATKEIRVASSRIGSQRLALLQEIAPDPFWTEMESARKAGRMDAHEVIILGAQCAVGGASKEQALQAAYYLGLALQANAIFKLIRIGQIGCQKILAEFLARADEIVSQATGVAKEDIGWFAPSLDIFSARHETAYSRLFIS
jgi:urease accessory protein